MKMSSIASFETVVASGRVESEAVEVFERTDGMGRSVRTRRTFKRGDVVCSFGGKPLQWNEEIPASDYLLQISSNLLIDGDPLLPEARGHVGNFINDAMGPIRTPGVTNNVRFTTGSVKNSNGRREKAIFIRAKKNLRDPGTELFISYGPSYWRRSKKAKTQQ